MIQGLPLPLFVVSASSWYQWAVFEASVRGNFLRPESVASAYGLSQWPISVANVRGQHLGAAPYVQRLWPVSVVSICL